MELEVSPSIGFLGECRHEGVRQISLGHILSLKIWIWASYLLLPNCANEITVILLFSLLSTNRAHPSLYLPQLAFQVRVGGGLSTPSPQGGYPSPCMGAPCILPAEGEVLSGCWLLCSVAD